MPSGEHEVPCSADSVSASANCLFQFWYADCNGLPRRSHEVSCCADAMPGRADAVPAGANRLLGNGRSGCDGMPSRDHQVPGFADAMPGGGDTVCDRGGRDAVSASWNGLHPEFGT